MKSAEIYALGYAIPCYDINSNMRTWRFKDEPTAKIPTYAVPLVKLEGIGFDVAKWSDVLKAKEERENSRNR